MSQRTNKPPDDVEHETAERFEKPFRALDAMDAEITSLLARHSGRLKVEAAPQAALTFLFAKSLKSLDAARLLATRGFGEDAFILLRSVLEALFSEVYIIAADSEERATNWIAAGYREQVRFLGKFPDRRRPASVEEWDPAKAERRARQWPNIEERAQEAGRAKHIGSSTASCAALRTPTPAVP